MLQERILIEETKHFKYTKIKDWCFVMLNNRTKDAEKLFFIQGGERINS